MDPKQLSWIFVGAMKIVAPLLFGFVYWKWLPPATLILIPALYIGIAIYALRAGATGAAAFCGIVIMVGIVVWFVPGPIHTIIQRALGRQ